MSIQKFINVATSSTATIARLGLGTKVVSGVEKFQKPKDLITLYVKESCPFSRKVREAFSMLDLDAKIKPCPIEGTKFRPELVQKGGKEQVPFMMDPNTNKNMYESKDIVEYIYNTYGPGAKEIPLLMQEGFIGTGSSRLATLSRALPWHGLFQYKGDDATSLSSLIPEKVSSTSNETEPIHPPVPKPIQLYSMEGSPFCRMVREALDSLEIPYIVHNVAKGSPRRDEFVKISGKMQVPYIIDENTDKKMFESDDIVNYLYGQYAPKKTVKK